MVEELDADHFIYGLVGTFYFPIDCWGVSTCAFYNYIMVKKYLNEVCQLVKLATLINREYASLVAVIYGYLDEGLDEF